MPQVLTSEYLDFLRERAAEYHQSPEYARDRENARRWRKYWAQQKRNRAIRHWIRFAVTWCVIIAIVASGLFAAMDLGAGIFSLFGLMRIVLGIAVTVLVAYVLLSKPERGS